MKVVIVFVTVIAIWCPVDGVLAVANDGGDQADEDVNLPPHQPQGYIPFPGSASDGECFKDFPHLLRRLTWEQLNIMCQQKRTHEELIFNRTVAPFTIDQQQYLDSLKIDMHFNGSASSSSGMIAVRQEIRQMSDLQRRLFAWAVRSLTRDTIDGVSKYDLLVMLHHPVLAPGSHVGAAFLPWHREYLRMFEVALRRRHPSLNGLPYWDSTLDSRLPNPIDTVLWHPRFFGNKKGRVVSGPLGDKIFSFEEHVQLPLERNVSNENGGPLTSADVDFVLKAKSYRELTGCVNLEVERTSRRVYGWVGGTMANAYYASQDVIFFLHHAFLDHVWQQFREKQTEQNRLYDYPPNYEACTKFQYGRSPMRPFGPPLRNIDGLSDVYQQYYSVEPIATSCKFDEHCSPTGYLFCHRGVCHSKIRNGGNCTGFETTNICHKSVCDSKIGRCVRREKSAGVGSKKPDGETKMTLESTDLERIDPQTWDQITAMNVTET